MSIIEIMGLARDNICIVSHLFRARDESDYHGILRCFWHSSPRNDRIRSDDTRSQCLPMSTKGVSHANRTKHCILSQAYGTDA